MTARMGNRALKARMERLLAGDDLQAAIREILEVPARRAVNPLFGFFNNRNPWVRWRAVTAMGAVVAELAESEMESARVIMRRLMWSLNDESGGIGWGSPEAMGEIVARSRPIADEFAQILVSYLMTEGNFIEHPILQRGVLWGIGRAARSRPEAVRSTIPGLRDFLGADEAPLRGLAAWAAFPLVDARLVEALKSLDGDPAIVEIYEDDAFNRYPVGDLARRALAGINAQ